jgi:hypothetical protein
MYSLPYFVGLWNMVNLVLPVAHAYVIDCFSFILNLYLHIAALCYKPEGRGFDSLCHRC